MNLGRPTIDGFVKTVISIEWMDGTLGSYDDARDVKIDGNCQCLIFAFELDRHVIPLANMRHFLMRNVTT